MRLDLRASKDTTLIPCSSVPHSDLATGIEAQKLHIVVWQRLDFTNMKQALVKRENKRKVKLLVNSQTHAFTISWSPLNFAKVFLMSTHVAVMNLT